MTFPIQPDNLASFSVNTPLPSLGYGEQEVRDWRHQFESQLISQCTHFCLLHYYYASERHSWGEVGEEAAQISFIRALLSLGAETAFRSEHVEEFYEVLERLYAEQNIREIQPDVIPQLLKDYTFSIEGWQFKLHDCETINRILRLLGSDIYLQSGDYGTERELILGRGSHINFGEYVVVDLSSEIIRTANMVTALAAIIGHQQIFIRQDSISGLIVQKWIPFLNQRDFIPNATLFQAGHQLKQLTCNQYRIQSETDLERELSRFKADMRENIVYHELGHGVIQHHALPMDIATVCEASKIIENPVIHGLLELLAEIAPPTNQLRGPIINMVEIAKTNHQRASGMFWMYMSDTWFFDTSDTYMFYYSELVALTFGTAINGLGKLDFEVLHRQVWQENGIYNWGIATVIRIGTELIDRLKSHQFTLNSGTFPYEEARAQLRVEIESETDASQDLSEYLQSSAIWHRVLETAMLDTQFSRSVLAWLNQESDRVITELRTLTSEVGLTAPNDVAERIIAAADK
ncbi:hypothetical protein EBR96_06275 [bacterium]|nr:hypothetical protein [bacterium]